MEPFAHQASAYQKRALDFMLDALGLQQAGDEALCAASLLQLRRHLPALLREQRRLRQRFAELEHELNAVGVQLDALDRAIDARIDAERERHADDI